MEKSKIIKLSRDGLTKNAIEPIKAGEIAMIKLGTAQKKDLEFYFTRFKFEKSKRYYVHRKIHGKYHPVFKSFIETVVLHNEKIEGRYVANIFSVDHTKTCADARVLFFMIENEYFAAIYAFPRKGQGWLSRIITAADLEALNQKCGTKIGKALLRR